MKALFKYLSHPVIIQLKWDCGNMLYQKKSMAYRSKGCTPEQGLPVLNAYTNSFVVCSCIVCIYPWVDIKIIGVRKRKTTYYINLRIEDRKYLYWCTPYWPVSQWNIEKDVISSKVYTCSINQLTFGGCCRNNSKTRLVPSNLWLHYSILVYKNMRACSLWDYIIFMSSLK